ncbi:unnamed protein product, partial [Choristocarpus tenellus]
LATIGAVAGDGRSFTVVNECSQTVTVGSTGGRITFGTGTDYTSKSLCDQHGSSGSYNYGPNGIGCYWTLPPRSDGDGNNRVLHSGEKAVYELYETDIDVRWSGTIWASTGCDEALGCLTGVCHNSKDNYICPPYVGPSGPTTKAEFTLSNGGTWDYYDVSNIDGINLPMEIKPDNPIFPEKYSTNHDMYQCGNPGGSESDTGLSGCSWSFEYTVDGIEGDLSQYLRMVHPVVNGTESVECEDDDVCSSFGAGICGVHPQRWANGAYRGGVQKGSCGKHVAWVSAGGACAGGWTEGEFPDDFPFYCGTPMNYGVKATLIGCKGHDGYSQYSHSGYTPGASSTSCGCPDWEALGIVAPPISPCNGKNPEWEEYMLPWATHTKKGC